MRFCSILHDPRTTGFGGRKPPNDSRVLCPPPSSRHCFPPARAPRIEHHHGHSYLRSFYSTPALPLVASSFLDCAFSVFGGILYHRMVLFDRPLRPAPTRWQDSGRRTLG